MRSRISLVAAVLVLVPLPALARPPAGHTSVRQARQAVVHERGNVMQLEHGVAAGEADNRAAAQRLSAQNARIAELKAQLQALDRAKPAPAKGS